MALSNTIPNTTSTGATHPAPVAKPEATPPLADVAWWLVGALAIGSVLLAIAFTLLISSVNGNLTLAWFISRGTGVAGYLLITGSMIYGLLITTKTGTGAIPVPVSFGMHEYISWMGLVFATVHATVLIFDGYIHYTLVSLLVPFNSSYRTVWVGIGQISFYAMALISASFYARKRMRHRTWQIIHYASFITFVLVTLHGIFSGTDSRTIALQVIYIGSGALIGFLTMLRILLRKHAKTS
jgi:predicted ferric reductase